MLTTRGAAPYPAASRSCTEATNAWKTIVNGCGGDIETVQEISSQHLHLGQALFDTYLKLQPDPIPAETLFAWANYRLSEIFWC